MGVVLVVHNADEDEQSSLKKSEEMQKTEVCVLKKRKIIYFLQT